MKTSLQLATCFLLSTLLGLGPVLQAQTMGTSPYFNNPALSIGYVDSCAQFWMNTLDETRGGFYTNIDRQGNVITSWGTNKNLLTQSRNAYGFVRAYMLTGNDIYRDYAEAGLDFMYEHAWDDIHGGWYSQLDANGNVVGASNGRSAFDAHYALLGPATAFEAFGDSLDLNMLHAGYDHLESVYWDHREGYEGYFDWTTHTGEEAYNKSFNATVDAITTHLLSLYLQTEDQRYLDRMHEISQQIIEHLVESMSEQAIGFVEEYDSDWNWNNDETMTIMGHVLKAAWVLGRVYQIEPRPEYLEAAQTLVDDVLEHGYDHDFGGPYKDYHRVSGEMLMWGNPDTAKAWWQMEQAITAGYTLWNMTNDIAYLEMVDETLHFFMQHFVDHVYGDIYENRTRYGAETWGLNKGGGGKAAYHSIETGYYNYIYGSAFLHRTPFSLYYWFEPASEARVVTLNPIFSHLAPLLIFQVLLNDSAYSEYDSDSRTLTIPANVGGEFKITFDPGIPTEVDASAKPYIPHLSAAYPNPFNAETQLHYAMDLAGMVKIIVFDIRGHTVRTLINAYQPGGKHRIHWNGMNEAGLMVPTGVYLIKAEMNAASHTQKVLLLK